MPWLSVSFEVPASDVEAISDALLEAGAVSVDVADAAAGTAEASAVFAEPGSSERAWPRCAVTALLPGKADAAAVVAAACARAGIAQPPQRVRRVADRDWVRATQSQFAPLQISPRLWIVPTWHAAPDPLAVNIVLDPGLAFGTGAHPTTRLALRWLEQAVRGGERVIDYGCGSGVLAIAALKLGAAAAVGVDVDEQALLAARRNAMQNQVRASFVHAAEVLRQPAQIVVANILAHPLIVLAPLIAKLTVAQGRLALGGVLAAQGAEVRAAYRRWFDMRVEAEDDGWVLLSGERKTD